MHKQLLLLHNAVSAYFSGNAQALEGTLRQFNIKVELKYLFLNRQILNIKLKKTFVSA